jgi:hypothetical protein
MNLVRNLFFGLASCVVLTPALQAQADYAAVRKSDALVGAGALIVKQDYEPGQIVGLSFWGQYNFTRRFGFQAEYNLGTLNTPVDIQEYTLLFGPRVVFRHHKWSASAKFMGGSAFISNSPKDVVDFAVRAAQMHYTTLAIGGGVDYQVASHVMIRVVDVEQQKWLNFLPHVLSPVAYTTGVSYIFRVR